MALYKTSATNYGFGPDWYILAAVGDIRRVGIGVVAANVAFVAAVVTVLAAGWLPLTALGVVMTLAIAAATLAFAYLQYLGVRRLA